MKVTLCLDVDVDMDMDMDGLIKGIEWRWFFYICIWRSRKRFHLFCYGYLHHPLTLTHLHTYTSHLHTYTSHLHTYTLADYISPTYTQLYTYIIHLCMNISNYFYFSLCKWYLYIYIYMCVWYGCVHMHMHMCVCIYVYMCICACIYIPYKGTSEIDGRAVAKEDLRG